MTAKSLLSTFMATAITIGSGAAEPVKLITLAPGHFHAALVQKTQLPGVDSIVHVYAPDGPELDRHLALIDGFNTRTDNPTHWETKVHRSDTFLEDLLKEKPGNLVVISGNNGDKAHYILECVKAGLNVLSDKPMAINPEGHKLIVEAFALAEKNNVKLLDIMSERHEITTMLQKEFSGFPEVFGNMDPGSAENPTITKESVHHFSKLVNGAPLQRPAWFFDPAQQGEAIVDVTTHLVDLVQWECYPNEIIKPSDVTVLNARSWPTALTPPQFAKVTKLDKFPEYLKPLVDDKGILQTPANGEITFKIKNVHAKVSVLWNFEAPKGTADTHDSLLRGTKANLHIRQGKTENYKPTLYIVPAKSAGDDWNASLDKAVAQINKTWPGVTVTPVDKGFRVVIPDKYKIGHEAHFGQVSNLFLGYLAGKPMPAWEIPNTLTKYRTLMEAYRMSR